jgi:PIN domain nuclease of toxin-antitoxin system
MNYLIDTHILLWYISGDSRIKSDTRDKIESKNNLVFVSNASLWEIAIKQSIGKLNLTVSLAELFNFLKQKGFTILEYDINDLETLQTLPFYHQDPFDRIIVSQAKTKFLEIITNDVMVMKYFS